MTTSRIKAALLLLLMVVSFVGAEIWRPTQHLADMRPKVDLDVLFPSTFGEWHIDEHMPVQLISPDQAAVMSKIYNQTLSRTYVNDSGNRIMLSVAFGGDQSDGTQAHRPEVCYPAQGFEVFSQHNASLSMFGGELPVRRLVARQGARIEPITYWVVVGERIALSGTQQKLAQLSYSTRGIIPDGMLVRVSSIDPNTARAYALQTQFVAAMAEAIRQVNRDRVFGHLAEQASKVGMRGAPPSATSTRQAGLARFARRLVSGRAGGTRT